MDTRRSVLSETARNRRKDRKNGEDYRHTKNQEHGGDLDLLRQLLRSKQPGPVDHEVGTALEIAWDEITGSEATKLYSYKLQRAEDLVWAPPFLTFQIERHGGTAQGSSRAEVYSWLVNIDRGEATCGKVSHRQLVPMHKCFKPGPLVEELQNIIENRVADERVEYKNSRNTVAKILVGKFVTANNKQTLTGRRKKFREVMQSKMAEMGWEEVARHIYQKTS